MLKLPISGQDKQYIFRQMRNLAACYPYTTFFLNIFWYQLYKVGRRCRSRKYNNKNNCIDFIDENIGIFQRSLAPIQSE